MGGSILHTGSMCLNRLSAFPLLVALIFSLNAEAQENLSTESARLLHERQNLSDTVWKSEQLAQSYETAITQLWDRLRQARDSAGAADLFKSIDCEAWQLPTEIPDTSDPIPFGITRRRFNSSDSQMLSREKFAALVDNYVSNGFLLKECEFHHTKFQPEEPPSSRVGFLLHLERSTQSEGERLVVSGDANVTWQVKVAPGKLSARQIKIQNLKVLGAPLQAGFIKAATFAPREKEFQSAHPVLLSDLDGDGDSEIVIPRWNRRYTNQLSAKKPQLVDGAFLDHWKPQEECGLIADLTNDGRLDYLTVVKGEGLTLYEGGEGGRFPNPGRVIFRSDQLIAPMSITTGDIDADGDLDLFLSQYKPSYVGGQMPTPFYDANDGFPAFLLRNEDSGNRFVDVTESAGLAKKRYRRTYSASFVDLDADRDLDLSVVSDYSGIDLYLNDGSGKFSDASTTLKPNRLFGMAQTFADFNVDGQLDLLAIGMSSSTARRLDSLGAGRKDRPDYQRFRAAMGYGNRMYLRSSGGLAASPINDQIARTGWSWGVSAFDFDNDGDRDIYVANGFRSGKSSKDYCSQYWCHDMYAGGSMENPSLIPVFSQSMLDLNKGLISWNGYEHNHLKMNLDGGAFENVAFLFGVSFEYDARIALTEDFDRDGREDLLVGEYAFAGSGFRSTFHLYLNRVAPTGERNQWIEFSLQPAPGFPVVGSTVTLDTSNGTQVHPFVAGDSFLSQDSPAAHFGLGTNTIVKKVTVDWPGDQRRSLEISTPALNRFHRLRFSGAVD
ncbi:MAG: hypothetical protein ACI9R3_002459 [Verrucomicrobiales bacterium]|jgi:hypothetical protein